MTVWGSFPAVEFFFIWGHTEQQKFGCVIGKHCSEEVERAEAQASAQKPKSKNMLEKIHWLSLLGLQFQKLSALFRLKC